jgi:hypothetical protein
MTTATSTTSPGLPGKATQKRIDKFLVHRFWLTASVLAIFNLSAFALLAWNISSVAHNVATKIATDASNDALAKIRDSQDVSKQANEKALKVYEDASNTLGRVSVLKEMLDEVERKKITDLVARVNALADLLDDKEADKRVGALEALRLFEDKGFIKNVIDRLSAIDQNVTKNKADIAAAVADLVAITERVGKGEKVALDPELIAIVEDKMIRLKKTSIGEKYIDVDQLNVRGHCSVGELFADGVVRARLEIQQRPVHILGKR